MGSGSVKPGSASARLHNHKASKYRSASTHYYYSSPTRQRTPSPPRRELTENEKQNMEVARVRAKWNAAMERALADEKRRLAAEERAIAAEKARLAAEAKRIANAIKQNNRLAAAAAANVNKNNLKKIFKNNKTILARLRRLWGRLHR